MQTTPQTVSIKNLLDAADRFRPKYRMERAEKEDCAAFRRNALRYCFNAEDERMHIAAVLHRHGRMTVIEYAVKLAESAARRAKYRQMLRDHLKENERHELSIELEEFPQ